MFVWSGRVSPPLLIEWCLCSACCRKAKFEWNVLRGVAFSLKLLCHVLDGESDLSRGVRIGLCLCVSCEYFTRVAPCVLSGVSKPSLRAEYRRRRQPFLLLQASSAVIVIFVEVSPTSFVSRAEHVPDAGGGVVGGSSLWSGVQFRLPRVVVYGVLELHVGDCGS